MVTEAYKQLTRKSNERMRQAWIERNERQQSPDPEYITHCEQTWQETMRSIEALTPVHFPGRLLDCQADTLRGLCADVATIHYGMMRTDWLCRQEFSPEAHAFILQECIRRGQAVGR